MSVDGEILMKALDDAQQSVAIFTGIKAKFIEAGWHEHNAERMVIQLLATGNNDQSNK